MRVAIAQHSAWVQLFLVIFAALWLPRLLGSAHLYESSAPLFYLAIAALLAYQIRPNLRPILIIPVAIYLAALFTALSYFASQLYGYIYRYWNNFVGWPSFIAYALLLAVSYLFLRRLEPDIRLLHFASIALMLAMVNFGLAAGYLAAALCTASACFTALILIRRHYLLGIANLTILLPFIYKICLNAYMHYWRYIGFWGTGTV